MIFVIALLIALAVGVFCFSRWLLHDDAADIQGTWQIEGTNVTIVINETEIRMTSDTIFTYKLDSGSKNITEKLDTKSGTSHYIFSVDRSELLIMDRELDSFSSFCYDGANLLKSFFTGNYDASKAALPDDAVNTESVTRLKRVS